MDAVDTSFMGGVAPVTVVASGQAKVDVNYQVRVVVVHREPDTLRRWAERIKHDRRPVTVAR